MARHWVKALTIVRSVDEAGNPETYHPGDFFPTSKREIKLLLARGQIEIPKNVYKTALDLDGCGIVVTGGDLSNAKKYIGQTNAELEIIKGGLRLPYPRTLIWDGASKLRLDLMPIGFHRLTTGWQVAVPIFSYETLAKDIGTEEDRKRTKEIIKDLRVPFYDTRTVYIRRCADTERLIRVWKEQRGGGDDRLAFLRAAFIVKPTICALPISWMHGGRR